MAGFESLIATGKNVGVFDFFLPFMLSFAIIYGILQKVKIFGEDRVGRTTNLMISVILSLFIIGYTPVGVTLATFFGTMFTGTIMIVVTLLGTTMVMYVLGKLGGLDILSAKSGKAWKAVVILLAIVVAAAAFVYSGGMSFFESVGFPGAGFEIPIPALPSVSISLEDAVVFGALIAAGAVAVWMISEGKGQKEE